MRDYSYLLVFVGFAVVVDIAFLVWGRRRAQKDIQYRIPFAGTEKRTHERRGSEQTPAHV